MDAPAKTLRIVLSCLWLLACHAAPATALRWPDNHAFNRIVAQSEKRWFNAICRTPSHTAIRIVKAPLRCGNIENAWGCHTPDHVLWISDAVPSEARVWTLMHEMGHTFNVKHAPPFSGIQSANYQQSKPYITRVDIDIVCEERDCPCRRPEQP